MLFSVPAAVVQVISRRWTEENSHTEDTGADKSRVPRRIRERE
jgi:hypothetical protein